MIFVNIIIIIISWVSMEQENIYARLWKCLHLQQISF